MIASRVNALRCAASLPRRLLLRGWVDERRPVYAEKFGLQIYRLHNHITRRFLNQLDQCGSDEARRLLLGCSR